MSIRELGNFKRRFVVVAAITASPLFLKFCWVVPPPRNSGKWRFIGSPTRNIIILVLTVTGQGDNPKYLKPSCFFWWNLPRSFGTRQFFSLRKPSFWNTEKLELMDLGFLFQKMVQVTLLRGHRFSCYTKSWIAGEILEKFEGIPPDQISESPKPWNNPGFQSTSLSFKFGFWKHGNCKFPSFQRKPAPKNYHGEFFHPPKFFPKPRLRTEEILDKLCDPEKPQWFLGFKSEELICQFLVSDHCSEKNKEKFP